MGLGEITLVVIVHGKRRKIVALSIAAILDEKKKYR